MNYYDIEFKAIVKANRLRKRETFDSSLIDCASNDYLGLASKKKLFKKATKIVKKLDYYAPKSSQLVNGYTLLHKTFEEELSRVNNFEKALLVGSGFLANISLIEGLVRKKDVLFIDEEYHASGMLASKLVQKVVIFKHNDVNDLENKIKLHKGTRNIIAIEGVYSMSGDIAPKEFTNIANKFNALLIVDEAHSSGVIGDNLLGWFDYYKLKVKDNYIKMGTLGKAYGSYGAYILANGHVISFLENRAKAIIYTTAPSIFDMALGLVSFKHIQKKKNEFKRAIRKRKRIIENSLGLYTDSLILPIKIGDNKKIIQIQEELKSHGFIVGAIRQPTVKKAMLRVIIKLDIKQKDYKKLATLLSSYIDYA